MTKQRWSSHFGFLMASTGAAVGLGPIWKFPYMAGNNGGSAFVLFYIFATILIGIPILIGEMTIGRLGRANPIASLRNLAIKNSSSKHWGILGWWGALALLLVLSFYSVIAGWSIAYIFKLWTGNLSMLQPMEVLAEWDQFLTDPLQLLLWHSIFMILTIWVVARGVQGGLEKASKIMMPALFMILLILMIYSGFNGQFTEALNYLFNPDFSKLTPGVMIDALGQAAFSLAIGAGCMLVYGCYVSEKTRIGPNALLIAGMLVAVSIMSGICIFPLVFEYGLAPEGGPGLMFQVLPIAFNSMPAGTIFGGLFFLLLWFAAWTSSISMAEPLVVILNEELNLSRKKGCIIIGIIAWIIGAVTMLSYNLLSGIQFMNRGLFDLVADFATNIILPTGALGFAIFAGWVIKRADMQSAMNMHDALVFNAWNIAIKFLAPIAILLILQGSF